MGRGSLELHNARLRWGVAFTPRLWFLIVWRTGLILDTRLLPPARGRAKRMACLYHLIDGSWESTSLGRFAGPTALVLTREHMDGADAARSLTYRTWGDPFP